MAKVLSPESIWADGRKYIGEYFDDKKNGYGEFIWVARQTEGATRENLSTEGLQHGRGAYIKDFIDPAIGMNQKYHR